MGFLEDRQILQESGIDLMPDINNQIQATIAETGNTPDLSRSIVPQSIEPTQASSSGIFRQIIETPKNYDNNSLAMLDNAGRQQAETIRQQQEPKEEVSAEDILLSEGRVDELNSILSTGTIDDQINRLREITGARTRLEMATPEENLEGGQQPTMLNKKGVVTTEFGVKSSADIYSGGINYGTDIAVPRGTKVAAPPGDWKVVEAFDGASIEGPKNKQGGINRGYGNSVLLQNTATGEKLRMSHLRVGGVGVKPGQSIKGGTIIGETGATGNTAGKTGQHLDLEYYNTQGKLANIRTSAYRKFLGI